MVQQAFKGLFHKVLGEVTCFGDGQHANFNLLRHLLLRLPMRAELISFAGGKCVFILDNL